VAPTWHRAQLCTQSLSSSVDRAQGSLPCGRGFKSHGGRLIFFLSLSLICFLLSRFFVHVAGVPFLSGSIACHRRSDRSAVAVSCGEGFFLLFICCFGVSGLFSVFLASGSGTYGQSSRLDDAWRCCVLFLPSARGVSLPGHACEPVFLVCFRCTSPRQLGWSLPLWQTEKKAGRSIYSSHRHHHRFVTSVQGYKSKI
jgi:hypothetical protein